MESLKGRRNSELLLQRKHNQEIANKYLSLGTVKTHTHNIFIKLQVEKRSEVCEVWEAFEKSELTQ
ncbi:LuxR C-terminal-related transcriptional regulator [Lactococcus lactis]